MRTAYTMHPTKHLLTWGDEPEKGPNTENISEKAEKGLNKLPV